MMAAQKKMKSLDESWQNAAAAGKHFGCRYAVSFEVMAI
jgi:hypothetical protein